MKNRKTFYFVALLSIGLFTFQSCSKDDDCTEQIWYQDSDGDGFGNSSNSQQSCTQPSGYVSDNTDFDDNNASAYPNAVELCNGIDDNGDGTIDENSTDCGIGEVCENGSCVPAVTYYKDNDGDLFGNSNDSIVAGTTAPNGYVTDNTDCDDSNANTYPGAPENTTDGIDNNCDGNTDECTSDADCSGACVNGFCYDLCQNDADCPTGMTCVDIGGGIKVCQ